jgi:rfaE bifunctional protein nucleotidyltransferase chain/domain
MQTWAAVAEWRNRGRLVFTNGVFDVLHAGHVKLLTEARSFGDLLVVGLNSDESVRRLKGAGRPVNPLADRALVVGALRVVDGVVAFDEDDPREVLAALRPQVHVKGGDYDPEAMIETPVVRAYGGEVRIVPLVAGRSSTAVLRSLGLE